VQVKQMQVRLEQVRCRELPRQEVGLQVQQ
jgi:hypothetical protein